MAAEPRGPASDGTASTGGGALGGAHRADDVDDGTTLDRGGQAVRIRVTAGERIGSAQTRISYEVRLPGGRSPHTGTLLLPFPTHMSELDLALRSVVADVLAEAGLPRQLLTTVTYE